MAINQTLIQNLTPEQFNLYAHKFVAVPELIVAFVLFISLFFVVGMIMYNDKKKWFKIWFIGVVVVALFFVIMIFIPDFTQWLVNFFSKFAK